MRRLAPHKEVIKDVSALPAKQFRQVVTAIFDLLSDPYPHYSKPISGSEYHRITVGEYRVIYKANAECIIVLAFGKRNDDEIYRMFERRQ